jgi:hypothetical protein
MNRAERRRVEREALKSKTKTYNLTQEQLNKAVRDGVGKEIQKIKQEATDEAINTAMILLLTLPLTVLMEHYWQKSYAQRLPKFTELLLDYYERWQRDELDMEEMKRNLWEYGGVRLEESE